MMLANALFTKNLTIIATIVFFLFFSVDDSEAQSFFYFTRDWFKAYQHLWETAKRGLWNSRFMRNICAPKSGWRAWIVSIIDLRVFSERIVVLNLEMIWNPTSRIYPLFPFTAAAFIKLFHAPILHVYTEAIGLTLVTWRRSSRCRHEHYSRTIFVRIIAAATIRNCCFWLQLPFEGGYY